MTSAFKSELSQFIQQKYSTPIGDEESLLDRGLMDSMDLLELMAFIEDRAGVQVPDEELIPENFETIVNISRLVARLQA